jgi:hypothetical protein
MFLLVNSIPFATSACKVPAQVLVRLCPAASSMIQHSLIEGEPEWSDKIKQVAGAPTSFSTARDSYVPFLRGRSNALRQKPPFELKRKLGRFPG